MKFNIGDKVRITKVNPLTRRQYERFIGTEWEVWEAKDNGEYILSFGSHKVWHEDQLELVERAPVPGGKRKYTGDYGAEPCNQRWIN